MNKLSPDLHVVKLRNVNSSTNQQWCNLKGIVFNETLTQWYNLRTSRFVNNKPGTYNPVFGIRGVRVLGTEQDIKQFWQLNKKHFEDRKLEDCIFEPFENIEFLSEDASQRTEMCFVGTPGIVLPTVNNTDVSSLTQHHMDTMCKFTFGGLFVKGRIDSVIDGDTFNIIFFVPLVSLSRSRALDHNKDRQTPAILTTCSKLVHSTNNKEPETMGFFTKVSIRMYGYDAAEKDTDAGKLAKRLIEEKIKTLGGIVWCQFIEATIADDKYGRTLAVLYEDEQKKHLLNNYLHEQEKIHNIKMVFPYIGGTKKKF